MEHIAAAIKDQLVNHEQSPGSTPISGQATESVRPMNSEAEAYDVAANIEKIMACRGVPPGFINSALQRPEKYDARRGYFLTGPVGVGKTHKAVAMMREAIIRNSNAWRTADLVRGIYNARFFPVTSLLMRIKDSFHPEAAETEGEIISQVTSPDLIVLDDLGAEKVSDWTLQTFYTIIDTRSREQRTTIITSNLSLDELSAKLSDRISSRIRGMCEVIVMAGKDRR